MKYSILNLIVEIVARLPNPQKPPEYQYTVRITNIITRKMTSFTYQMGEPSFTTEEVSQFLECICNDAVSGQSSLEDFCQDFEYNIKNTDDIDIWKACKKIGSQLSYLDIGPLTMLEQLSYPVEVKVFNQQPASSDDDYYITI